MKCENCAIWGETTGFRVRADCFGGGRVVGCGSAGRCAGVCGVLSVVAGCRARAGRECLGVWRAICGTLIAGWCVEMVRRVLGHPGGTGQQKAQLGMNQSRAGCGQVNR